MTIAIIEPPALNGGIASRTSVRPQRQPTPVGPSILCPENAIRSTSSARTSTGMCGTDWQASSTTSAPTSLARATIGATSLMVPRMFDWWTKDTTRVFSVITVERSSRSRCPSSVSPIHLRTAPVLSHSSCQGTRLAWCSISVTTISSPGARTKRSAPSGRGAPCSFFAVAELKACVTMFNDSVALRVNTRSWARPPTNPAMTARADSKASVACSARKCAPRCTAALCRS